MLHGNRNHLHENHDHEGAKYRIMLQQLFGSQNLVFSFPPHSNSFEKRHVYVEVEKLGLKL